MADNITLNATSGGPVIATDNIESVHFQKAKQYWGADGTATPVSETAGEQLPVSLDSEPLDEATHAITAKIATDKLMNDLTACTPKFATINVATAADHSVVAAVTGKKIRVVSLFLSTDGTGGNARFESGAGGTALTGIHELTEELRSITLPFNPCGWFETASGEALSLEWSAAQNCDGFLTYIEV